MRERVVNNTESALMLEDGTQLGPAYTPEATRTVKLSETDHSRFVETGRISILERGVVVDIPGEVDETSGVGEAISLGGFATDQPEHSTPLPAIDSEQTEATQTTGAAKKEKNK